MTTTKATWYRTTRPVHAALANETGGTVAGTSKVLAKGTHVQVLSLEDDRAEVRSIGGYVTTINIRAIREA